MATSPGSSRKSDGLTLLFAAAGLVAGVLAAVDAAAVQPVPRVDSLGEAREHLSQGAPSRAVFHLRRHLQGHPEDAEARALLARTYLDLGLIRAALSELRLVLAQDPADPDARALLAEAQLRSGHAVAALATLVDVRGGAGAPTERSIVLEARCLHDLGRHGEAALLLEPLRGGRADDADFQRLYGLNALHVGTPESLAEAVVALRRVTELSPGPAAHWNNLGFALERAGRLEEAWLAYVEAEGRAGDDRYASSRHRVEEALGRRAPRDRAAAAAAAGHSPASRPAVAGMLP